MIKPIWPASVSDPEYLSLERIKTIAIEKLEYCYPSADLEVQLVQLNQCDGEYSNY